MSPPLNAAAIAQRIPHAGTMCLLDTVEAWDPSHITCTARSQCSPTHPMAVAGRLATLCGIEYAAQAMAMHGALLTGSDAPARGGRIASVRDVAFFADHLHDQAMLTIHAERLADTGGQSLYSFSVHGAADVLLVSGRAAVILDPEAQ